MNTMLAGLLCAAQLVAAAAPATAANLVSSEAVTRTEVGTFIGAQMHLPLDRRSARGAVRSPRLSLSAGPSVHAIGSDGAAKIRVGRGLQLGVRGEKLRLDLAGRPISRLVSRGEGPEGRRNHVSTVGWVAIGAGVILVSLFALASLCRDGEICGSE